MSRQLEQRLNECLEALSSGKRTLEECLSMYPEDAARLEPLLRTAALLGDTFAKEPRPEFAAKSRERFLRMTERRLTESLAMEPRPSFVMAARRRFLSAAQQMIPMRHPSPWRPAFRMAAVATGVLLMVFLSLGGFAVSTSANALPGDWQYPVKRTIEDVRFTLTFDDGGRQSLDIEFAQERLKEIQKLGEKGRTIGEGPLDDLADQTNSLAKANLNPQDAQKVTKLALEQQQVLQQVAPLVEPNAADELQEAKTVSTKVYVMAASVVLADQEGQTTSVSPSSTEEPANGSTPTVQPAQGTPTESAPGADTPTPAPQVPEVTPIPNAVVVAPIDNENAAGVSWVLLVVDRFSVQAPSEASGWHLLGLEVDPYGVASAPFLLRVTNADLTAIIVVNPRNGDVYWEQYTDGIFRELFVRKSDGPVVWQATEDALRAFGPDNAEIVLHVANSISIAPRTATPTPVPSPTPEATTSASGDAATPTPAPGG